MFFNKAHIFLKVTKEHNFMSDTWFLNREYRWPAAESLSLSHGLGSEVCR